MDSLSDNLRDFDVDDWSYGVFNCSGRFNRFVDGPFGLVEAEAVKRVLERNSVAENRPCRYEVFRL